MFIARIHQSEQKIGKVEVSTSERKLVARLQMSPPSDIPLEFGRFVIAASLLSSRITVKVEKLRERVLNPSPETEKRIHLERERADRLAAELEVVRNSLGERLREKQEQLSTQSQTLETLKRSCSAAAKLNERIAAVQAISKDITSFVDQQRTFLLDVTHHSQRNELAVWFARRPKEELPHSSVQDLERLSLGSFTVVDRLRKGLQEHKDSIKGSLDEFRLNGGFTAICRSAGNGVFTSMSDSQRIKSHLAGLSDEKMFSQVEHYLSEIRLIEEVLSGFRKYVEEIQEKEMRLEKLKAEVIEFERLLGTLGVREAAPSLPKTAEGAAASEALKALRDEVIKQTNLHQEEERLASGLPDTSEAIKKAKGIILDWIALYQVPVLSKMDEWIESTAAASSSDLPDILSTIINALGDAAQPVSNSREKMNALKELEPSLISSAAQEAISGSGSQVLEASQLVSSWCDEMDKPWSLAQAFSKLQKAVSECSVALSKLKDEMESSKEDERIRSLREMKEAVAGCVQSAASQLRAVANASPKDSQALMNRIAIMEESQLDEVIAAIGTHFLTESGSSELLFDVGKTLQMRVKQWGITLEPNFPNENSLLINH